MPDRQCRVSQPLRRRLAHHGDGRRLRRRRGGRASCSGCTEQRLVWALGIAATQAAGLREMFGSMCKPLHPGMAAKNGLYAALLAQQDFTSTTHGIEGKRGFANVLATERDYEAITEAPRRDVGARREHVQAVRVRHRHPSDDRRLHPAAQRASSEAGGHRAHRRRRASAGAGADRQEGAGASGSRASSASITARRSRSSTASSAEAQFSDARVVDPRVVGAARRACARRSIRRCTKMPPTCASRCATERSCPGASSTRSAASPGR